MKKLLFALSLVVPVLLFVAHNVWADPRMETNNNFCHFIMNPDNTDYEVFMAGCNAEITVAQKVTVAQKATPSGANQAECENENNSASGYGIVEKLIPASAISIPPGKSLVFTNNSTNTPCTMVESNGREYRSNNWQSSIKVTRALQRGYVIVHYELYCWDGEL